MIKKLRLNRLDRFKGYEQYKDWGFRSMPNGDREYYFKREYRFTIEDDWDDDWFNDNYVPKVDINQDIPYRIKQYRESNLNMMLLSLKR
jgi:hypothetical protein